MLSRNLLCLVGTATVIVANLVYTKVLLAEAPPPADDPNRVEEPVQASPQANPQETQQTQPTEDAQTTTFVCGMSQQGGPTTIAQTPRGDIPIILWVSKYFEKQGFNPQLRCQVVSARFQTLYSTGNFNYIGGGTVDNLPVICATKGEKDNCTNENALFTLEPNDNPAQLIKQLEETRGGAAGPITRGRHTINVRDFLAKAPAQARNSASRRPQTTTTPPITTPSQPPQPAPRPRVW